MNGVIGMASLLHETEPLSAEQKDYVETIISSGDTLLTLINDVLDCSKIEANQMEIERFPFDLRRGIEEMLEIVAVKAREKHLDVAAEIDPAVPPMVLGDAVRLRQVLTNLVGNAIKFTSQGEVVVELRTESVEPGKHRLFSGFGIPELAFLPINWGGFSNRSAKWTPPLRGFTEGPGWDWRSVKDWSN